MPQARLKAQEQEKQPKDKTQSRKGNRIYEKSNFEQNEMFVMEMFDAGNRKHMLKRFEKVFP